MSVENGKEIGEKSQVGFLPYVEGKTIQENLLKLTCGEKFVFKTFKQMEKDNSNLAQFLINQSYHEFDSYLFLEGAAFTYQCLFNEAKNKRTSLPLISKQAVQTLSEELDNERKIHMAKEEKIKKETEHSLVNLLENENLDFANPNDLSEYLSKISELFYGFAEKDQNTLRETGERIAKILPFPNFYCQENPHLMEAIKKISLNPYAPQIEVGTKLKGAMFTYELLRRQAETDYLEKKLGLTKS